MERMESKGDRQRDAQRRHYYLYHFAVRAAALAGMSMFCLGQLAVAPWLGWWSRWGWRCPSWPP